MMQRKLCLIVATISLMSCESSNTSKQKEVKEAEAIVSEQPIAEKHPHTMEIHGDERVDPYFWMRLSDEQKESEAPDEQTQMVLDYLQKENAYTKHVLKPTEPLQEKLFKEIIGRIKEDDSTVPHLDNGYYFYDRYEKGKEYEILCRSKSIDGPEEILLDINELAKGYDYYDIGDYEVSTNNTILAYSYDNVSRRQYSIRFKNLETGELYPDVIENTSGEIVWANDNKTIFYIVKDPQTLREFKVFRHVLGSDPKEDELVFEETDETYVVDISKSNSDQYIFIESYSTMSTETQYLNANDAQGAFKVFHPREEDLIYTTNHHEDGFYVLTNWNALNFRLMKTPLAATEKQNWKERIAHRSDTRIVDVEIFSTYLVIHERTNGLNMLRIMKHDGSGDHYIEFNEETYAAGVGINMEYDSHVLRYNYSSLRIPSSIYDYDMQTGETTLMKRQEVLGGYDPERYETKRVWAPAEDGKMVPISLVYLKGMKLDGSNPLLLYGYGSYGVTISDRFVSSRFSLVDRGFVYAIAHIRGSEYLGRDWYEDGKKLKKKNTFTDFTASADFLIQEKYTSSDKIFAMGGSAGGLLMGAVMNMRPELFKGVIAGVPFVDVVSTMLDESIP